VGLYCLSCALCSLLIKRHCDGSSCAQWVVVGESSGDRGSKCAKVVYLDYILLN
jgi:hypothetical protein